MAHEHLRITYDNPNTGELYDAMRAEIIADIGSQDVPATVASFAELHDYCDANEYGAAIYEQWDAFGAGWTTPPAQDAVDAINAAQCAIDEWIRDGRMARELATD